MGTQPTRPIVTSRPASGAPGAGPHRHIRAAAAIAGVGALIAAGGYLATTTIGPDAIPPAPAITVTEVNPSAQTLRDMRQSIPAQYGNRSATGDVVDPSTETLRELQQSITGQYGSRPAGGAVVHPSARIRRELRSSIANQYGHVR
jgi:hypothetical protein